MSNLGAHHGHHPPANSAADHALPNLTSLQQNISQSHSTWLHSRLAEQPQHVSSLCFTQQMATGSPQYFSFAAAQWCPANSGAYAMSVNGGQSFQPQQCTADSNLSQVLCSAQRMNLSSARHFPVLDPDTKFYLLVLLGIAAANSVFTFIRAFSFAYGGLVSARKLHEQLLSAIVHAPSSFFQTTPTGVLQSLRSAKSSVYWHQFDQHKHLYRLHTVYAQAPCCVCLDCMHSL